MAVKVVPALYKDRRRSAAPSVDDELLHLQALNGFCLTMCPIQKTSSEEAFLILWNFEVNGPERVEKAVRWKNNGKHLDFVVNFLPYSTTVHYAEEKTSFKARVRLEPVHLRNHDTQHTVFKTSWIKVNEEERVKMGNHFDALESDVFELSLKRDTENETFPSPITIQAWVEVASQMMPPLRPTHKCLSPLACGSALPYNHLIDGQKDDNNSCQSGKECKSRLHLINITNLNPETVKKFENYMETGEHFEPVDVNDAQHLYDAASQCALVDLRKYCVNYLKREMNLQSAISILMFANLRSIVELQEAALNLIAERIESVRSLPDWRLLMQNRTDLALLISQRITSRIRATVRY